MRNKSTFLVILLLLCAVLQNCTKPERQVLTIPQYLKDAWDFQTGSYWIYKDDISGRIDSSYIYSNENDAPVNYNARVDEEYVYMRVMIVHTDNGDTIDNMGLYDQYNIYPNSIAGMRGYLRFPLEKALLDTDYYGQHHYFGSAPLTVNGKEYLDTHLCVVNEDTTYFKLGIGVVAHYGHRIIDKDTLNRRYTLLRYSVKIK
jgi:hypothetical protein